MNYQDLADLIFPDTKEISYYKEKYPARNLAEGAEVTRIAPSPTGYIHIGNIFGALTDYKIAKQSNGIFILRIEDTDQKREVENGVIQIIKALQDFGIVPDEGMVGEDQEIGDYGPYKQSKRKEIYEAFAKHFLSSRSCLSMFCNTRRTRRDEKKTRSSKN